MKSTLFKEWENISGNRTVIKGNTYFDDTQFYTGVLFALGASVLGALANILVAKCSSYSSLLLTFWRYITIFTFFVLVI